MIPFGGSVVTRTVPYDAMRETYFHRFAISLLPGRRVLPAALYGQFVDPAVWRDAEFLILVGAFQVHRLAAVLATAGIIFAAVYLLWMYQRVVFGPVTREENRRLGDLSAREWVILTPVLALIFWIGVYPVAFTGKTEATVEALLAEVTQDWLNEFERVQWLLRLSPRLRQMHGD